MKKRIPACLYVVEFKDCGRWHPWHIISTPFVRAWQHECSAHDQRDQIAQGNSTVKLRVAEYVRRTK